MGNEGETSPEPSRPEQKGTAAHPPERVVNTQGGDYAEGDIDKRQGTFVEGDQVTVVTEEQAYDVTGLANPYLGLRAFTYADRASFAGRDALVRATSARITMPGEQQTLLFITGASGSGKSSFAQAGLLPVLVTHYEGRNLDVSHAVIRPGTRPLAALADGLLQLNLPPDDLFAAARPFMVGVPSAAPSANAVGLLIVDQFEEVFSPQCDPAQRDTLFAILAALPPFEALRMHVIVTVRADFLPELFAYPSVYERAKQGVDLRAMQVDELKEAIQRPLQHAHPDKRFEPSLLDRLATDAAEDAAYLPLLQVTLEDLFRRGMLTPDRYHSLADSLRERADAVQDYSDHDAGRTLPRPAEDREEIIKIFVDLVRVSLDDDPRRDVRRRRPLSALLRGSPAAQEQRLRLIRELLEARLLSTSAALPATGAVSPSDVEVDIIHESLLTRWERLRSAIAAQRTALEQRERFSQALAEWKEHAHAPNADEYLLSDVRLAEAEALKGLDDVVFREADAGAFYERSIQQRDEARKRQLRRTRQVAVGLAALALLALIAAAFAVQGQRTAGNEKATAEAERQRADLQAATARAETLRADGQAATAVAATDLARQRAQIARVRELAAQSRAVAQEYPQRSVLLAVEAVQLMQANKVDVPEATEALAAGVAAMCGEALPAGEGAVTAHATSANGRWAALGKENGEIVLIGLSAPQPAKQLRVLTGDARPVAELYLSDDGRTLIAAYRNLDTGDPSDRFVRLWDLQKAEPEAAWLPQARDVLFANYAVSLDARWLAGLTGDGQVRLWALDAPQSEPLALRGQPSSFQVLGSCFVASANETFILRARLALHDLLTKPGNNLSELTGSERVRAGETLAWLCDERPGVTTLPDALTEAYWCGSSAVAGSSSGQAATRIARYPVTVVQFKLFLDGAGGYYYKAW